MDQAQLLSIIGSAYDKLVADVAARIEAQFLASIEAKVEKAVADVFLPDIDNRIEQQVKAKIDDLTGLDKAMITEIVKGEIEDLDIDQLITDWMDNNFDITDHESNLDIEDKISDYLSDHLTDRVRDEVRDLSFSVTVD